METLENLKIAKYLLKKKTESLNEKVHKGWINELNEGR